MRSHPPRGPADPFDGALRCPVYMPFIGQKIGGSHVSAFTLADSLVKDHGVRCSVIAGRDTPILAEAASMGFGIVPHDDRPALAGNGRHGPLYDLQRLPARVALLRGLPKGILHLNDIGGLQSWLLPAKLLGWPMLYHHRAINRTNLVNKVIIGAADHTICISDATRRNVHFLPDAKADTVTDPFAIERASSARGAARSWLIDELGLDPEARIVGFAGNFWYRKRPSFFLEVAAAMAPRDPRAAFVVFGRDGDLTVAELTAEAQRLGLGGRVHFPGFRLPVERNIAALDLLLMPAVREPFGRTPIEALLLGTPYVATDDAGHSEIARRWSGGRVVPLDADAEAFASVALEVLADPASVLLPPARRDAIERELSPREYARTVIEIYRTLSPIAPGRPASNEGVM